MARFSCLGMAMQLLVSRMWLYWENALPTLVLMRSEQLPQFLCRSDLGRDVEHNAGTWFLQGHHLNKLLVCFTVSPTAPLELLLVRAMLSPRSHPTSSNMGAKRVGMSAE